MIDLEEIKRTGGVVTGSQKEQVHIEFIYFGPDAKEVYLAGSFNAWQPKSLPMTKNRRGQWKTTVKLVPGTYEYKYFVDGSWVSDGQCDEMVANSLGSTNCTIDVAPRMDA
jgi:1,4-alpha-glucan branching enzyme